MVNYQNAKIVSVGSNDHSPSSKTILFTTQKPSVYLADLKRKYKLFQTGKGKRLPIYDVFDSVGISNTRIQVLGEQAVNNKKELNQFFADTKTRFDVPIEETIKKTKERKDITNQRYESNVKVLMKFLTVKDTTIFFYHPKKVIDFIMALQKSDETKKNYIKAILSIIPRSQSQVPLLTTYGDALMVLQERINGKTNKQERKQNVSYKTPQQLDRISQQLKADGNHEDHLISLFYTGVPYPVWRLKELQTLKYQNANRQTDNYIDWGKNQIVLNDYKTFKEYGQVRLPLKKEVKQAIIQNHTGNTDYVLTDNQNRPYTESALSKKIKSVMGYCVDDLRSMYITYNYEEGNLHTEEQKISFCKGMRNSPSVLKYYIKF